MPLHMNLSAGLLACLNGMEAGLPGVRDPKDQTEASMPFMTSP